MKGTLAIFTIAATLATTHWLTAQSAGNVHMLEASYRGDISMNCYVNGVTYPVDDAFKVWARNNVGNWFIIGRLVNNGFGYFVVRNDGVSFAAVCN